jgi:hypothetical protein
MQTTLTRTLRRPLLALALGCCLAGCATTDGQQPLADQVAGLQTLLDAMRAELAASDARLAERDNTARLARAILAESVAGLESRLERLPEDLLQLCPSAGPVAEPQRCESASEVRTIIVSSDKLVVGEVERVWIEPPGANIVARVDTGADSSSLHAEEMIEFERDGRRWVRFNVKLDSEVVTIERPIKRFVRILQQADPEGSRRPVVDLRLRLGNVTETVDFTLADRSHLNYEMLLGRNFLTDVALVDVGKQFIQPPVVPRRSE